MKDLYNINWKSWKEYINSKKSYSPDLSEPGGFYADSIPEYTIAFFETQKVFLKSFFKMPEKKRLNYLASHNFITFKDSYIKKTHSYGHICEENIFSADGGEAVGCSSIALERLYFNYLSQGLKLPEELYKSWCKSVFITWEFFYLPELLEDLKLIVKENKLLAKAHYYLAECYQCLEHEDLNKALEEYQSFIDLSKNKVRPINNYFISENFHDYFAYVPSIMEAYKAMAQIFLSQGKLEAYENYLVKSIDSDEYSHIAPYLELAYFYFQSGKALEALKYTYIYENVFEAQTKSLSFSDDFFNGTNVTRSKDSYISSTRKFNWKYNSNQSDCLEVNNHRLRWRFKKYPYLAISLKSLDTASPNKEGHKSFFQVSYKDVETLIDNFCMNIMFIFIIKNENTDLIDELFEKVINKKSYTWECFPELRAFKEDELIELVLKYFIEGQYGYQALDIINNLLETKDKRNKMLLKYKEELFKKIPWLEKNEK